MAILIRIRLLQLRQQLVGAGIVYLLGLLLPVAALLLAIYKQYAMEGRGTYVTGAIAMAVLSVHLSRKDYPFVMKHIRRPVLNVFSEYAFFTAPLTVPALFTGQWYHTLLLLPLLYAVASLRIAVKQRTILPKLHRLIPPADFEWLSGFRRRPALIALWALAVLLSPFRIVPLLPLWLVMAGIASFYEECESLAVLRANGRGARHLIHAKIGRHCRLLLMLFVPVLLINALFNRDMILVNLLFLIVNGIALVFAILLKYAAYTPNTQQKGAGILLGIAIMCPVLPFLLPVPLLLAIRFYPRALRNLTAYTA